MKTISTYQLLSSQAPSCKTAIAELTSLEVFAYLREKSPPRPVAQFQVRETVALNNSDRTKLTLSLFKQPRKQRHRVSDARLRKPDKKKRTFGPNIRGTTLGIG